MPWKPAHSKAARGESPSDQRKRKRGRRDSGPATPIPSDINFVESSDDSPAAESLDERAKEMIEMTQRLLDCISDGDWDVYVELVHPDLTCFEPEARGHLVSGLPFHEFYFKENNTTDVKERYTVTMQSPKVQFLGKSQDVALVTYIRLIQMSTNGTGPFAFDTDTVAFEETRVWEKDAGGAWKHVHFHRSKC